MIAILRDLLELACLILALTSGILALGWLTSWAEEQREIEEAAKEYPE